MRNVGPKVGLFLSLLLLMAPALLPAVAGATTGPTPLAHPPRFQVTKAQAAPYLGRYTLVQPSSRQLISGAYIAGYNERQFVEGTIEIYTYDAEGRETIVFGRTYEYHAIGDQMEIDIISPDNQAILARLKLHPAGARLTGTLTSLMPQGKPEAISLAPAPEAMSKVEPEASAAEASGSAPAPPSDEALAAVVAAVQNLFRF